MMKTANQARYDKSVKRESIALVRGGGDLHAIAERLSVPYEAVVRWTRKARLAMKYKMSTKKRNGHPNGGSNGHRAQALAVAVGDDLGTSGVSRRVPGVVQMEQRIAQLEAQNAALLEALTAVARR
jgi:transposase-like protein